MIRPTRQTAYVLLKNFVDMADSATESRISGGGEHRTACVDGRV